MARKKRGCGRDDLNGIPRIDLHRFTRLADATHHLREELIRLRARGWQRVLVIHGIGSGALRDWIAHELYQHLPFAIDVAPVKDNGGRSVVLMPTKFR